MTKSEKVSHKYWVIVPAAGIGSRMQSEIPKQYLPLRNVGSFISHGIESDTDKTVIEHSIHRLLAVPAVAGVVVCIREDDSYWNNLAVSDHPRVFSVIGGEERMHSVYQALVWLQTQDKLCFTTTDSDAVDPDAIDVSRKVAATNTTNTNVSKNSLNKNDFVLVHDAVRPCIRTKDVESLIRQLNEDTVGGLLASPLVDSLKRVDKQGAVIESVQRDNCWRAQTPQMFRLSILKKSIETQLHRKQIVSDEASAVEALGLQVKVVEGASDNLKLTLPSDLLLLNAVIQAQANEERLN